MAMMAGALMLMGLTGTPAARAVDPVPSTIAGAITSEGAPIEANVFVRDSFEDIVASGWSDPATGEYVVEVPAAAGYTIEFTSDGKLSEFYDDASDIASATPVEVTEDPSPGAPHHNVDADLAPLPQLAGTVTAGGEPTGAQVRIYDVADIPVADVTADAQTGRFAAELEPGDYRVRVKKPGYISEFYSNKTSLSSADPITVSGDAPGDAAQFRVDTDLAAKVLPTPFAGLQNPSFEAALDPATNWTPERGNEDQADVEAAPCAPDSNRGVCVVGQDSFTDEDTGTSHTVTPVDGSKMLRLGGPFTSREQTQLIERYSVKQRFIVDPQNPTLALNYNAYMYDYTGFDELRMSVTLKDEDGDVVYSRTQGAFASGTSLKTTGWVANSVDLTQLAGQVVTVKIEAGGTKDNLYGWWVYVDAGAVPEPVVGKPVVAPTISAPNAVVVPISVNTGPGGQTYITVPASAPQLFDQGCLPLPITSVPINAGQGTISNARLVLKDQSLSLIDTDGDGSFEVQGELCAVTGTLFVQYTLTEGDDSANYSVPIGGVTLIDPQGVVFDIDRFTTRLAELGSSPDCLETVAECAADKSSARQFAAIDGAEVTLERLVDGQFVKVLSGDPGISPNVNPQVTAASGIYQWDVAAGTYRVRVQKAGFIAATTESVLIPPPVLDLHVGLKRKVPGGSISVDPVAPIAGKPVTLTLSATHPDGEAAIKSVRWDLDGDGEFDDATGQSTTLTPTVGARTVRAQLTDDDGDVAVVAGGFTASAEPQPNPPAASGPGTTAPIAGSAPTAPVAPVPGSQAPAKVKLRTIPKKIKKGRKLILPQTAATGQGVSYKTTTPKICRVKLVAGKPTVSGRKAGACRLRVTIRPGKGLVTTKKLGVSIRVR